MANIKFIRKVRKSGNSSPEITIPKPLLDAAELAVGDKAELTVLEDEIVIRKLGGEDERKKRV